MKKTIKLNILHTIDINNVSSINKESVWDDVASPEIIEHLRNDIADQPVIMGRKTWESIGEKPFGHNQNIVISRKKLALPRAVKQLSSIELLNGLDKKDYAIIGGVSTLISIPMNYINSIILYQIKDNLLRKAKRVNENTYLPDMFTELTKEIESQKRYSIRMWSKDSVDI